MSLPSLKVGDILLYSTKDIVDSLIEWKTSGTVAHVEIYAGNGTSWASRNGIGLGNGPYPFRIEGLVQVRRPIAYFDPEQAEICFETKLKDLPYGFGDIEASVGIMESGKGVDCSHAAAILLEEAGSPQFDSAYPKTTISPRDFLIVRESTVIYQAN